MIKPIPHESDGEGPEEAAPSQQFHLNGMHCADCARRIEQRVGKLTAVEACSVNFGASRMRVGYVRQADPRHAQAQLMRVLRETGYEAVALNEKGASTASGPRQAPAPMPWWQLPKRNAQLRSAAVSCVFILLAWLVGALEGTGALPVLEWVRSPLNAFGLEIEHVSVLPALCYAAAIALGGWPIALRGIYGLIRTRSFDVNLLMTLAVLGAAVINEWAEGAMVVFLFSLGEGLESLTVDRARDSIRSLMALAPAVATLKLPDGLQQVPVEALAVGDVIAVRPGERIPADGVVVAGASGVNQAPITGESLPVDKAPGDLTFAGTINGRGYLEVSVTRPASDTTLARTVRLIEEAQAERSPTERFVDRFARYYTPAVLAGALLVAVFPPLLLSQPFLPWFYRALVLLVVSCPCALVISTPVAVVAAMANASRHGVLIKGGAHLEEAGSVRAIAFDKTGTLTAGRPEVVAVSPLHGYETEELIALAAVIETRSEHPLADAILRRRQHDKETDACEDHGDHAHEHDEGHVHLYPHDESEAHLEARRVDGFEALAGRGARLALDERPHYVGSPRLFEDLGIDTSELAPTIAEWESRGHTVMLVGDEREVYGAFAISDPERPAARTALAALKDAGVRHTIMLTGDNERTARAVATQLGVDEYRAGLLPEDKVNAVKALLREHRKVAMVGDGINDAPALATATVGVAMGAAGSDAALETADIALMGDDLSRLPYVIRLSRRALRTIHANIAFALLVKAIVIGLTFAGITNLWLAILADTGATLIVIAYGMRLLRAPGR